jgi:hypothetical protein
MGALATCVDSDIIEWFKDHLVVWVLVHEVIGCIWSYEFIYCCWFCLVELRWVKLVKLERSKMTLLRQSRMFSLVGHNSLARLNVLVELK